MKLFIVNKSNGKREEHDDYYEEIFMAVGKTAKDLESRFTDEYFVSVIATEVTLVDGYEVVLIKPAKIDYNKCPNCKKMSVIGAPGGGVKCVTPKCGYWECF